MLRAEAVMFVLGCAAGGAAIGFVANLYGMYQGQRDAEMFASTARAAGIASAKCKPNQLPGLVVVDPADPRRDKWLCFSGSGRRAALD